MKSEVAWSERRREVGGEHARWPVSTPLSLCVHCPQGRPRALPP